MPSLSRENAINIILSLGLLVFPFIATAMDEPFYITLATRVAILSLAAVGLNLALGTGGWSALVMRPSSALAAMPWASWPVTHKPIRRFLPGPS